MLSTIGSIASQDSLVTWDRYNTIITHHYSWNGNFIYQNSQGGNPSAGVPVDFSFSEANGFSVFGTASTFDTYYGLINASGLLKLAWNYSTGLWEVYKATASDAPVYTKGVLAQAGVKAVAGTYPDNGYHTDGYWYVKRI